MEPGGSTTQGGIEYQNSVAVIYIAKLLNTAPCTDLKRVVEVRVEAPTKVDDTVVTYADDHHAFIQAKENVRVGDTAWNKLWEAFDDQYHQSDFQRGRDRLLLHVGTFHDALYTLRDACERASESRNHAEWWDQRLTQNQRSLVERIKPLLSPELLGDASLLSFFKHIDVIIWPQDHIENGLTNTEIPPSNLSKQTVFRLVRDRVVDKARVRGIFTAEVLRTDLRDNDNVQFEIPSTIETLRETIQACGSVLRNLKGTFGGSRIHVQRTVVDEIVSWSLATDTERVAMLLDQAGMGKTVVLQDVVHRIEVTGAIVLAIKADQDISGTTSLSDLQRNLALSQPVVETVARLAVLDRVVVVIDQIDALSLSLARDQRALNIALDLVARLRRIPGVTVLISCRTFDRKSDPQLKDVETGKEFSLPQLSDEEVLTVLQAIGIDAGMLTPATWALLHIPLHLDLFVRAVEVQVEKQRTGFGIENLQDLYALLWRNVVLKSDPDGPPVEQRVEVLDVMTACMQKEQQTLVPAAMFEMPDTARLQQAVAWLSSSGILVPGISTLGFLHQTFFDYCYARQFVMRGGQLAPTILDGSQGFAARPHIVQVLTYLRGTNGPTYLRELNSLLHAPSLRFHLRDLVIRWFGSLLSPNDNEWRIANHLLADSYMRPMLLRAMHSQPGWWPRMRVGMVPQLLGQDEMVDSEGLPYVSSLIETAQAEVVTILRSFVGQSNKWNQRIIGVLDQVSQWQTDEALDLFETMVGEASTDTFGLISRLDEVAKASAPRACRIIRIVIDRVLNEHPAVQNRDAGQVCDRTLASWSNPSLSSSLEALNTSMFVDAVQTAARAEPQLFLDALLPWIQRVVGETPDRKWPYNFTQDALSHWESRTYVVQSVLIETVIGALEYLSRRSPDVYHQRVNALMALPYETPQQLLARTFALTADVHASAALAFLLGDHRRLMLGNHEQSFSCHLITTIYPFLSLSQRNELEAFILDFRPVHPRIGRLALSRFGIEQFNLLRSIPMEYLSERGVRRLREMERKFPNMPKKDSTVLANFRVVGPPISHAAALGMSDHAWLRAMSEYRDGVGVQGRSHSGARGLASVLTDLIRGNPNVTILGKPEMKVVGDPERFYELLHRIPDTIDDVYVSAFVTGFAGSTAPSEWVFATVRRFADRSDHRIRETIAMALEKRVADGVPDDLLDLLESYAVGDEAVVNSQQPEDARDPYSAYLNSSRGHSFLTLMRGLDQRGTPEAMERKWLLIDRAASDPSTSLRAGAIGELLYILHQDRERAIRLFERLMDGHPALVRTQYTREFIYYGIYQHFDRMKPFIIVMMEEDTEDVQQQGAELACIAHVSRNALESDEAWADAQVLADRAIRGCTAWRRGAARVYAQNLVGGPQDVCERELSRLLDDEDETVRKTVASISRSLQKPHMNSLRTFLERFAAARVAYASPRLFATYLSECGEFDPTWTFTIIHAFLDNVHASESRWFRGAEELIRFVVRIYNDPIVDDVTRMQAMELFDQLMKRYTGPAQVVLQEWDRR